MLELYCKKYPETKMKTVNIMNFARSYEPRDLEVEKKLLDTTRQQMDLVNELGVKATFLLQYDVICNEDFVSMIKSRAGDNIELGFWYEVVEPLTTACNMPYNSKRGWKWDWYIHPGFSVSYSIFEREKLIDEAMRKFREVFGYYPRTVGSWLFDTHTVNYLCENYEIDMMCYCRDQVNTDAYTFVGGYFNGAYFPSKKNYFTPAQTEEYQLSTPMFRLLGPDPIRNYDNQKFASKECNRGPYTMEVVYNTGGRNPKITDWYLNTYFNRESLGYAYMQIGQENSFAAYDIIEPLRMQIEKIMSMPDVKIEKMCESGRAFKAAYKTTPAASILALDNWDSVDCQSVIYNSKNYNANVMRVDDKVFIRGFYLFDERITDVYEASACSTFDAVYENMPLVDTYYQRGESDGGLGMILCDDAVPFNAEKVGNNSLKVFWLDKSVVFEDDRIIINNCKISFTYSMINTKITTDRDHIYYEYKGNKYAILVKDGEVSQNENTVSVVGERIILIPQKEKEI